MTISDTSFDNYDQVVTDEDLQWQLIQKFPADYISYVFSEIPKNLLKASDHVNNVVGTAKYIPTKTHLVVWTRYIRDEPDAVEFNGLKSVTKLKDFDFGKWNFWITQLYRLYTYFGLKSDYHIWIEIPNELIELANP
jgi:hypothetical protein